MHGRRRQELGFQKLYVSCQLCRYGDGPVGHVLPAYLEPETAEHPLLTAEWQGIEELAGQHRRQQRGGWR